MRTCFHKGIVIGLGVPLAALFTFAPQFALGALPLVLVLACPLLMMQVMRGMGGDRQDRANPAGTRHA